MQRLMTLLVCIEAMFCLVCCDLILRFAPRTLSRRVIDHPSKADQNTPSFEALAKRHALIRGYLLALRLLPWRIVCLPQALAGRWMLNRRGIANTLSVGVKRDASANETDLHAWLSVADRVVLGGHVDSYNTMIQFGHTSGLPRNVK